MHHCGATASLEYVHTLQPIDVATGWSERAALPGHSYRLIEDAFRPILARIPFTVRELHPDNGSEFFNRHLLRLWGEAIPGLTLSRSRPFRKSDNRFVQQNSSLVRSFLGQERLDTVAHTLLRNRICDAMRLYYNLFQPVMHLCAKMIRATEEHPAHLGRHHDQARPPFDRLCHRSVATRAAGTTGAPAGEHEPPLAV